MEGGGKHPLPVLHQPKSLVLIGLSGKSTDYWLMSIDNGKLDSVVFLDVRKAFDTVDHDIFCRNSSVMVSKE